MTKPKRTTKRTTQPITGTPERLPLSELREMATLCKRHWGSGSIRDLVVTADGHYRPTLIVKVFPPERERRIDQGWTKEELASFSADCAERERLADLYDRVQAARGDSRRAARS